MISPWDEHGKAKRRQVSVSYLIFNPYIVEIGSPPIGIDGTTLETLSKSLDIKVDYVPAKTFTELVDLVATDKVDFCLSHPSIALHRFRMGLDFITMYWRNMFYIQRYPVPVDSLYTVSYPFTIGVWRATLATVIIVALVLSSLNYFYGHRPPMTFQELSISYKTIVGANVPSYWFDKRKRNPYYIIFFIWLLFGSILSVAYQSNLLANLVKVEMEEQPQTFQVQILGIGYSFQQTSQYSLNVHACHQDLIDMQIGMYIVKGSILTSFLRDSPREVHRNVYKESLLKHGGFYPDNILPPDVMDIILDGKAVTLWPGEGLAIYQHLLVRGQEPMPNGPVGYLYRMNLPIRDELDKALMTLLECGTIKEVAEKVWYVN